MLLFCLYLWGFVLLNLVDFELRHYPIRKSNGMISSNTFSATTTQVTILEQASQHFSSPYKSIMLKGPKFLPQSPSKKKDQINAVDAFHPGELYFLVDLNTSLTRELSTAMPSRSNLSV